MLQIQAGVSNFKEFKIILIQLNNINLFTDFLWFVKSVYSIKFHLKYRIIEVYNII